MYLTSNANKYHNFIPKTRRFDNNDSSVGIVPNRPPCCNARRLNSFHSFSSTGIVPTKPLFSKEASAIEPSGRQARPPHSHSLDGVNQALLPLVKSGNVVVRILHSSLALSIEAGLSGLLGALH